MIELLELIAEDTDFYGCMPKPGNPYSISICPSEIAEVSVNSKFDMVRLKGKKSGFEYFIMDESSRLRLRNTVSGIARIPAPKLAAAVTFENETARPTTSETAR